MSKHTANKDGSKSVFYRIDSGEFVYIRKNKGLYTLESNIECIESAEIQTAIKFIYDHRRIINTKLN